MKTTNIIRKSGVALILFMATTMFNSAMAQDKYSFAISSQKYTDDYCYYFVSDPVKNWDKLSEQEQEDFNIEFKMSAKKQTGEDLVKEYRVGFFRGASYYDSLAEAKQGIEKWIEEKENMGTSAGKEIKVIKINLYKYR